ncbi:MAG: DNA-3-methyladenine glycosylase 2 family protein [Bryobacterales bacterium]|nr:DNA-3-methyladenine glycosylase 2 family protein [Bryobacterales bacterium]
MIFSLQPVAPFRLDFAAWAIRRRPENRMDVWDGTSYQRVLAVGDQAVHITVTQSGEKGAPQLTVTALGAGRGESQKAAITEAVERLLGTRVDLRPFYRFAATQPRLGQLAAQFRGLKPPRFPTVFEAVVNGIACQQLSLAVGITLLNRLSAACGLAFSDARGTQHAFPRPVDLAAMSEQDLRPLGFSRNKSRALIELACGAAEGRLDLEALAHLPEEEALARLLELRGVGRWTAEYVLLRGLGRTNVFPGDDVGARNNLARWLRLRKPLDYDRVASVLGTWKQFGGLVYFHLLLSRLERSAALTSEPGRAVE